MRASSGMCTYRHWPAVLGRPRVEHLAWLWTAIKLSGLSAWTRERAGRKRLSGRWWTAARVRILENLPGLRTGMLGRPGLGRGMGPSVRYDTTHASCLNDQCGLSRRTRRPRLGHRALSGVPPVKGLLCLLRSADRRRRAKRRLWHTSRRCLDGWMSKGFDRRA